MEFPIVKISDSHMIYRTNTDTNTNTNTNTSVYKVVALISTVSPKKDIKGYILKN